MRGHKELMSVINKRQAHSTRERPGKDQPDTPLRNYPRRTTITDDESESGIELNPETSAFISSYRNPRAVSGPSARLSNPEDSRRFTSSTLVELPQITRDQLLLLQKMEMCYYIDDNNLMRDRHTGQVVNLK